MDRVAIKDAYKVQGYVKVPGLLNEADIASLRQCAKRLTDEFVLELQEAGKLTSGYGDEPLDKRIVSILEESGAPARNWTAHFLGRELYDLIQCPRLVDVLEVLVGPDVFFVGGYQLRAKQPTRYLDRLTEFPWHQDTQYYGLHTKLLHIVTAWIPLIDVDEENGCLWFIPGSHKWGAFEGERDELQNMHSFINVEERGTPVSAPAKVGDVIFFHNLVFHSSQQNKTQVARWNVDIRFSPTPGIEEESKEVQEAYAFFAENMAKRRKPSMVVRGQGAGIAYEEWRAIRKAK